MADEAVTPVTLTINTVSGDVITTGAGGVTIDAGNTAVIDFKGETRATFITLYAASAATVTILQGDEPPSESAGLGDVAAQTIPAGDCLVLALMAGQFVHGDSTYAGKVRISVASNDVVLSAFRLPRSN